MGLSYWISAWHVRLKQYYPDSSLNQDIKHSRVVTGVNNCHIYKEKKDLPDLPIRPHQPVTSEFISSGSSSDEENSSPRKKPRRRSSSSPDTKSDRKKKPSKEKKERKLTEKKSEKSLKDLHHNGGLEKASERKDYIKTATENGSVTTNGVCIPAELKPIEKGHRASTSSKHSSKDLKQSSKHHGSSSSSHKHKESKHSSRENKPDGSKSSSKPKSSSSSSSSKHRDKYVSNSGSSSSSASKLQDNNAVRNLTMALEEKTESSGSLKVSDSVKPLVSEPKKTKDLIETGNT